MHRREVHCDQGVLYAGILVMLPGRCGAGSDRVLWNGEGPPKITPYA